MSIPAKITNNGRESESIFFFCKSNLETCGNERRFEFMLLVRMLSLLLTVCWLRIILKKKVSVGN